jgi:hypothetical protein
MYECKRCLYQSDRKYCLINHLKKKKECRIINLNISRENLIKELENNTGIYTCKFCGKEYKNRQSKYTHQKKCKDNKSKEELIDENNKLKEEIRLLKLSRNDSQNNQQNNIIIGNNNNIDNSQKIIVINNFGEEKDKCQKLLMDEEFLKTFLGFFNDDIYEKNIQGLLYAINKIHFNKNLPENHNIKYKNMKLDQIDIYENNRWMKYLLQDFYLSLINNIYNIIKINKKNNILNIDKDNWRDIITELRLYLEDPDYLEGFDDQIIFMKKSLKQLRLTLYNGTQYIKN